MTIRRAGSRRRARIGDQVQGRPVAPVQILENEDQGAVAVIASTASAISRSIRSRVAPPPCRSSVSRSAGRDERWQLQEPRWGVAAQDVR